jgi:hypothetical protein
MKKRNILIFDKTGDICDPKLQHLSKNSQLLRRSEKGVGKPWRMPAAADVTKAAIPSHTQTPSH